MNIATQKQILQTSHIVVATPSTPNYGIPIIDMFLDSISRTGTSMNNLLFFILDEADK